VQALVAGIAVWVIISVLSPFTCGLSFFAWVIMLFWAYKAYQGQMISIPVISDLVKNQGWA
jgi:uncharacterized membrane protein